MHVHSPEVGKNVQDHILHGGCLYEAPEPFVYRNSAANVSGYYKTDPSFERPDVSIVQIELPYASDVIAKRVPAAAQHLGPLRRPGHAARAAARCGSGPPTQPTGRSWTCAS